MVSSDTADFSVTLWMSDIRLDIIDNSANFYSWNIELCQSILARMKLKVYRKQIGSLIEGKLWVELTQKW